MKYLKYLMFTVVAVLILSGCSIKKEHKEEFKNLKKDYNQELSYIKEINSMMKDSLVSSYANAKGLTRDIVSLDKNSQEAGVLISELDRIMEKDDSKDEKTFTTKLAKLKKLMSAFNEKSILQILKKSADLPKETKLSYNDTLSISEKFKKDFSGKTSNGVVIKKLEKAIEKYPNKSNALNEDYAYVKSLSLDLDNYVSVLDDGYKAYVDKKDLDGAFATINIHTQALDIKKQFDDKLVSINNLIDELDLRRTKKVVKTSKKEKYYMVYLRTDYDGNPIYDYESDIKQKEISRNTYMLYKPKMFLNFDGFFVHHNYDDIYVVQLFTDYDYFITTQEIINGKNHKPEEIEVSEDTYREYTSLMNHFRTTDLIVEQKMAGQLNSETSYKPYPSEYGEAYAHVGDPNFGSWNFNKDTGENEWHFTDGLAYGLVGAFIGNALSNTGDKGVNLSKKRHYSYKDFNKDRDFYKKSGYGQEFDKYGDRDYLRQNGYVGKTYDYSSSSSKPTESKGDKPVTKPKFEVKKQTGLTGGGNIAKSDFNSKNGINYKTLAKPGTKIKKDLATGLSGTNSATRVSGLTGGGNIAKAGFTGKDGIKHKTYAKPKTIKPKLKNTPKIKPDIKKQIEDKTKKTITKLKNTGKIKPKPKNTGVSSSTKTGNTYVNNNKSYNGGNKVKKEKKKVKPKPKKVYKKKK